MALKKIDGSQVRVDRLVATIFGQPNVGKTSLGLTARNPLLLDFDRGSHRAQNRSGKVVVTVDSWADVKDMAYDDVEGHDTIVVDTASKCLDAIVADIIKHQPKLALSGSLTLPGWGALGTRFRAWLNMLRSYGKDVVLLSQVKEETKKEETSYRLSVQGSSRSEITENSDIMGLYMAERGKRRLSFKLGSDRHTKNVGRGLDDYLLDRADNEPQPGILAEIIDTAKALINEAAQDKAAASEGMQRLRGHLES